MLISRNRMKQVLLSSVSEFNRERIQRKIENGYTLKLIRRIDGKPTGISLVSPSGHACVDYNGIL